MFHFGDVMVDPGRLRVTRAGAPVDLEPKSLRVLLHLIEHRDRAVTKDELFDSVWAGVAVTDNALTRVIAQLRRSLGDDARQARYIETIPTIGYRFIGELRNPEAGPAPAKAPGRSRRFLWWTAAAALPLAGLLGWSMPVWHRPGPPPPRPFQPRQWTNSPGLDASPAFSPDGQSLAYASDRSGNFELYIRPLTPGAREVAVTTDGGTNVQAAWSPDGRYLAYHSVGRGGLYVVPAPGGPPRQIAPFGSQPAWSPDGQWIAFRSLSFLTFAPVDGSNVEPSELWLANVATGELRKLAGARPFEVGIRTPSWSRDGRWVLFAHEHGIDALEPATGRRKVLVAPGRPLLSPVASARFVYYVDTVRATASILWRLPVTADLDPAGEPAEVTRLGGVPQELRLSSDGRQLAYSLVWMNSNLWSQALSASGEPLGQPRPFTNNTNYRNSVPVWSPDGQRVAFQARRMGNPAEITLIQADGTGEETVVTESPQAVHRHFTPDSQGLYLVRCRPCQAEVFDLATRRRKPLAAESRLAALRAAAWGTTILPGERTVVLHGLRGEDGMGVGLYDLAEQRVRWLTPENQLFAFPNVSPDSRWVAAERFTDHGSQLTVQPLAGGAPRVLTSGRGHAWSHSWSPDSDKVAFAGQRDGRWNLYWKSRTTGQEQQLTSERSARVFVRYPAWSPRGGHMLFERAEVRGNLWIATVE